jgi:hypothetical protein
VTAPAHEQYIEATPASRRKLVVLFAVLVVAALGILEVLLPQYLAFLRTMAFCEQLDWVEGTLLAILLAAIVPAPWSWITSRRILRLEQWPLPGSWVWQRTRVERGPKVRWRGRAMAAAAIAMLTVPMVGALLVHDFLGEARATRCDPARKPAVSAAPFAGSHRRG